VLGALCCLPLFLQALLHSVQASLSLHHRNRLSLPRASAKWKKREKMRARSRTPRIRSGPRTREEEGGKTLSTRLTRRSRFTSADESSSRSASSLSLSFDSAVLSTRSVRMRSATFLRSLATLSFTLLASALSFIICVRAANSITQEISTTPEETRKSRVHMLGTVRWCGRRAGGDEATETIKHTCSCLIFTACVP
jgi:hypothetical protein